MSKTSAMLFLMVLSQVLGGEIAAAASPPSSAHPNPEQLRREIQKSQSRIKELHALEDKATQGAQRLAPYSHAGAEHFKRYKSLLKARYSDENGDFVPGSELSTTDRINVGKLLQSYLRETLNLTKLSAGRAVQILEQGRKRLEDRAAAQESPSEKNNSELQILSNQIRTEEELLSGRMKSAKELGLKL